MVSVTLVDRKSNALTPSSLRCLSHLPTINMTAGCNHGCVYCYIRGYSQYPGDDSVVVYRNTAEQVERELARRRKRTSVGLPGAVYFCPSSDAFMPVEEVLDQSFRTMRVLLENGVGVQFVTKGAIPGRFFDLFARHPERVAGQIGLTTLDDRINTAIEPQAAPAQRRLADLHWLCEIGVTASLRADPMIHGVTDDKPSIQALFAAAADRDIRDVSISYLFLRPAIVGSLRRSIRDADLLRRILKPFDQAACLPIRGGNSGGRALPADLREAGFNRARDIAQRLGLRLRVCGCKNGDLTAGQCHLTSPALLTKRAEATAPKSSRDPTSTQLSLYGKVPTES